MTMVCRKDGDVLQGGRCPTCAARVAKQDDHTDDASPTPGPTETELQDELTRRVGNLQAMEPNLSDTDAMTRALGGRYEHRLSGKAYPSLYHAFAACVEPVAKSDARARVPMLAAIVEKSGTIATLEAQLGKSRNADASADPSGRSAFDGPAARRLGQLRARQLAEIAEMNARGAGRVERNRVLARHTREMDQARAAAAVEAYSRSPVVKADYDQFDRAHRAVED